jgi:hypothetical protein
MTCSLDSKSVVKQILPAVSVVSLLVGLPTYALPEPITPEAVRAAKCMVDVLKTVPGYVEAHVEAGGDHEMPLVVYAIRASNGQIFHRMVEVYEDSAKRFSINMSEGVTRPLFEAWHRCGVTMIDDTSP